MPKGVKGFVKGSPSANPKGRPKKPEIDELRQALKIVEKRKRKSFLIHFVERAYEDNSIAIALAKKIIPDLSKIDSESSQSFVTMPYIQIDGKPLIPKVGKPVI